MLKEPVAKRRWAFEIRCSTFEINIEQGISNDNRSRPACAVDY